MPLALDELDRRALGPDRFADSAHRTVDAQVLVDEILPGRDDPGRVRPDFGHVGEVDVVGRAVKRLAQQRDLVGRDDDEHRAPRPRPPRG